MNLKSMNGNGAAHEEAPVQINPLEVAQVGLMFLARCDLKPAERSAFSRVEMLLQAIAGGQVQLAARDASEAQPQLPLGDPPATHEQ